MNKDRLLILRIISGQVRIVCTNDFGDKQDFIVKAPTIEQLYKAEEKAHASIETSKDELLTQDQIFDMLCRNELWSTEKELELNELPGKIDNLKINLCYSYFKSAERVKIKKRISELNERALKLSHERYCYDYATVEGLFNLTKTQYLIGACLCNINGEYIWNDDSFLNFPSLLLESALKSYKEQQLSNDEIRHLSRNEYWKSIWSTSKIELSLFNRAACEYTDEQKSIVLWSKMYDSILESPESPPEDTLDDDDFIDGWILIQHKKNKDDKLKHYGEGIVGNKGSKLDGKQEIFIPVSGPEDIKRVEMMNDEKARQIKRNRMKTLEQLGSVSEQFMPDSKLEIKQQAMKEFKQKIKET